MKRPFNLKFLTDENIFPKVVSYLRNLSHEVKDIKEAGLIKITDDEIIQIALAEERVILTFDRHFGDIIKYPPQFLSGIIHIRIHPPLLEDIIKALDNFFKTCKLSSLQGKLVVLSRKGYRIR